MDQTPASLLERLRRPNESAAWAQFVDLFTPLLYSWTCRMGLQAEDAADVVQEVFIELLRAMPVFQYDARRSFRAWLRTVLGNKWRDNCRRRNAALRSFEPVNPEDVLAADGTAAFDEAEYRAHLVGRAAEIMQAEFQPATWQAFWALTVEAQSGAAVAAALGMTVDAVYAAKSRVLRRLRQELDGLLD